MNNGIGSIGENSAAAYLLNKGYMILARNYRTKFGEIDIITQDQSGMVVFIEVKTLLIKTDRKSNLMPEDNLSQWKLYKLRRICNFFANKYSALIWENGWRIDLIAIVIRNQKGRVKHYQNI